MISFELCWSPLLSPVAREVSSICRRGRHTPPCLRVKARVHVCFRAHVRLRAHVRRTRLIVRFSSCTSFFVSVLCFCPWLKEKFLPLKTEAMASSVGLNKKASTGADGDAALKQPKCWGTICRLGTYVSAAKARSSKT